MYSGIRSALQAETASAEATRPSTVPQHCVEQQNDPAYGQKGPRSVCILPAFQYILIGTRQVKRHNVKPLFLRIHNCDEKPKQPQLRNFALHRPSVQYIEIMLYKQIATLSEPQHLSNPRAGCCLKSSTLPCSFPPSGASFSCLPMIPWTGRKNAAPRQFWTAFCPNCIILCHNNGYKIKEYLPTLLKTATSEGYEFVTISELLLEGETVIDVNGVQKKAAQ